MSYRDLRDRYDAALRSGDGWTRVEDGLPQKGGKYLLCIDGNVVMYYLAAKVKFPSDATHWRPLPPAPEEPNLTTIQTIQDVTAGNVVNCATVDEMVKELEE